MMKLRFVVGFIILILFSGLAFYQYGKFLPTFTPTHKPLSAQVIQQLNQTKPVTSIEVFKSQRLLQLKHQDEVIRSYPIRLGFNPIGHKQFEGDGKTPEGTYSIDWRNPKVLTINPCIFPIQIKMILLSPNSSINLQVETL
jgi:murein L,D-transpeptidase YafK